MYNVIQSKLFIVPVVIGGLILAASGVPALAILGVVLVYGFFALLIVTAIARLGLRSAHCQTYLIDKGIQLVICSLLFIPALYFAIEKSDKFGGMSQAEIRAYGSNAAVAKNLCTTYFKADAWDHYVRLRELSWCSAFPEYDTRAKAKVAAASIDEEHNSSTMSSALWK